MQLLKRLKLCQRKNRKLLVIYNISGVGKRDEQNCDYYIRAIRSILNQKFNGFHVVVSGCKVKDTVKGRLLKEFGGKISYVYTDDLITVNISFNNAVIQIVNKLGPFEGYLYIDSGVEISCDKLVLQKMYDVFISGPYAMVLAQSESDNNYRHFFKDDALPPGENPFIVPVGVGLNMHVQLFSHELYEKFDNKILPDRFYRNCTESSFTFICASIGRNLVVCRDTWLPHYCGMDCASAGFPQKDSSHYNDSLFGRTFYEIITDPRAAEYGFGFEEQYKILMHDANQFDQNHHCKNDNLYPWLKESLWVEPNFFDYNKINTEIYI